MPRRKKAAPEKAAEVTVKPVEATETVTPEPKKEPETIKTPKVKAKDTVLSRNENGGVTEYLIEVNGEGRYYTASTIEVLIKRQMYKNDPERLVSIKIPKGSPYIVPEALKGCKGCG